MSWCYWMCSSFGLSLAGQTVGIHTFSILRVICLHVLNWVAYWLCCQWLVTVEPRVSIDAPISVIAFSSEAVCWIFEISLKFWQLLFVLNAYRLNTYRLLIFIFFKFQSEFFCSAKLPKTQFSAILTLKYAFFMNNHCFRWLAAVTSEAGNRFFLRNHSTHYNIPCHRNY